MDLNSLLYVIFVVLIISAILSILYHHYIFRRKFKNIPQCGGFPFGVIFEVINLTDYEIVKWSTERMLRFQKGIYIYWMGTKPFVSLHKPEFLELSVMPLLLLHIKIKDYGSLSPDITIVSLIDKTAMGVDVHAQEVETNFTSTIHRNSILIRDRMFQPWLWQDWIYNLVPSAKEYNSGVNRLHKFTREIARQSHDNTAYSEKEDDDEFIGKRKRKAFLDLLLDQNERADTPLTDDEVRAQVDTFMFEGHDTTAVAITWTLFLLGNNLEHQEKVHEELEEVFKDSETPASVKELSQLKYLDRVIKETLRLYPSVPMVLRNLTEDVNLGDFTIPKGVTVEIDILLMHRNPKVWPDPNKFDPDRFLPENSNNRNPYAYVPFSAGPRNCIGQRFALLEEKTILTAILRKWRLKSVKKPEEVEYGPALILRPTEDVFVHFTPKNN
ncbi:cytochrome P450 4C1-like [Nylanderia fulva]|uniref:cytochrome P450 4C1-like n=1 Tax=Nylanderia fulva TaxID=613905 RepID=UPI0010FB0138|nr:cytochrome P450 4C1-like [Nylanderia fulva]